MVLGAFTGRRDDLRDRGCRIGSQAKEFVLNAWDASGTGEEIGRWRFAEEKAADWLPGDRFPISKDWERKRLGLAK